MSRPSSRTTTTTATTARRSAALASALLLLLVAAAPLPAAAHRRLQGPSAASKNGGSHNNTKAWTGEIAFATVASATNIDILTITPSTTATPRTLITGGLNAHPAFSSPSDAASLIAFSGKRSTDATFQIYTASAADGSGAHPVTAPHGYSMVPGFSCRAGGVSLKLAFEGVRDNDTVTQAFLINADGTGSAARIWPNPGVQQVGPKFSPNCKQLTFAQATNNGTTQDLFVLDVGIVNNTYTFSNLRQLTFGAHNDFSRSWSPDGKQIVFNDNVDGVGQLFIVTVKTSKLRQLTFNDGAFPAWAPGAPFPDLRGDVTPAWSPDSRFVAFCRQKAMYAGDTQGTFQVYLVDTKRAGAEPVALTNLTTQSVSLAWRGKAKKKQNNGGGQEGC